MSDEELYGRPFMELHASVEEAHPELAGTVLGGLFLHCYSLCVSQLQSDRSIYRVLAVAREIEAMHEKTASMVTDSIQLPQHDEPQKIELACKKGCALCCHIRLTSTPLEVIAIAERLRAAGSAEESIAALKQYEDAVKHLAPEKRLVTLTPCPFLTDGLCTVYSMRPSACRTYHSFDLSRCIADFESPEAMLGVPQNPVRLEIGASLFDALQQACNELGLEHDTLEFVTGVRMALEDKELTARWLQGEDCFTEAVDPALIEYAEKTAERMNLRS